MKYFPGWGGNRAPEGRVAAFVENLGKLTPGTYMFVEHPAFDTPEMQTIGHTGYENVGADRDAVTRVFTSPEVMAAIQKQGIQLVSYADLQ